MTELANIRHQFAAEIRAVANLQSEALIAAFAKVGREHFLAWALADSDPRHRPRPRIRPLAHEGEDVDESAFKALVRQAVALNGSGESKPSKKAKS